MSSTSATMTNLALAGAAALVLLSGCARAPEPTRYDRVERLAFNRAAVRLNVPVFWIADSTGDGIVKPDDVVALLFYGSTPKWVSADGVGFTEAFEEAYEAIVEEASRSQTESGGLDADEAMRRQLVREDLDAGIATLVLTDLESLPGDHQQFAHHMLRVAGLTHDLYLKQNGGLALADRVPADDLASQSLFRRNRGPRCAAPGTELDPRCSAIPGAPTPLVDVYPGSLQVSDDFCSRLEEHRAAQGLLNPFVVVRESDGDLVPVPYTEAYAEEMLAIAGELRAAADALTDDREEALRTYLRAAAQAYTDNQWEPADEAWASMNARNSGWYVRVAPDEVYWDPCAQKAGFHLTLARINQDSLAWQERLEPVRQEMEKNLAELVGSPYQEREVSFQLPDFIDIVANAGDDRDAMGATIGQSLPNWGPVSSEGRGRTVAMSNLYTDPDSLAIKRDQAESLFDESTIGSYSDGPEAGLLGTILHEAAHNLGPAHEYRVDGKTDSELFGGGLASVIEELKAQSAALWYVEFLRERGLITDALARESYVDAIRWAFGHISRGMYTATGGRKAYSQLAAIQVGFLLQEGALLFEGDAVAANGSDHGVFAIDFDAMPGATEKLMQVVGGMKSRGDRAGAEELCRVHVDGDTVPQEIITERFLRHPKASFVYAVR